MKKTLFKARLIFIACLFLNNIYGQVSDAYEIPDVPFCLPAPKQKELKQEREHLMGQKKTLQVEVDAFNLKCTSIKIPKENTALINECTAMQAGVDKDDEILKTAIRDFNKKLRVLDTLPQTVAGGDLVKALDLAAQKIYPEPPDPKSLDPNGKLSSEYFELYCNAFFKLVGIFIDRLGMRADVAEWKSGWDANRIFDYVMQSAKAANGNWKDVTGSSDLELQKLANSGIVVIGLSKGANHGHIAVVSPVPCTFDLEATTFGGFGPMIRDGDVHVDASHVDAHGKPLIRPAGRGTIRASKAWGRNSYDGVKWYIWLPSVEIAKKKNAE